MESDSEAANFRMQIAFLVLGELTENAAGYDLDLIRRANDVSRQLCHQRIEILCSIGRNFCPKGGKSAETVKHLDQVLSSAEIGNRGALVPKECSMNKSNWLSTRTVMLFAVAFVAYGLFWQAAPLELVRAQGESRTGSRKSRGEQIYVPIYSSIFYENGKSTLELAATLSIHNVNPDGKLTLLRADYHDTKGKLIKKYVDKPVILNPLETKNIVIDRSDTAGGTGANFLVEWQAQEDVVSPLVESVMVNATSNLGIAFTTVGKVVKQTTATDH